MFKFKSQIYYQLASAPSFGVNKNTKTLKMHGHKFSSIYRCSPETSKWEGLMPQVGWDSSEREGRFRVGFGLGHINKAQPIWSWPAHLELALTHLQIFATHLIEYTFVRSFPYDR